MYNMWALNIKAQGIIRVMFAGSCDQQISFLIFLSLSSFQNLTDERKTHKSTNEAKKDVPKALSEPHPQIRVPLWVIKHGSFWIFFYTSPLNRKKNNNKKVFFLPLPGKEEKKDKYV